jgi:hypothetical protein
MACADKCTMSTQLLGFGRILPTVRRRFFEGSKSDHEIVEGKREIVWTKKCVE